MSFKINYQFSKKPTQTEEKLRCCKATGGISFRQQIFPMYEFTRTILYRKPRQTEEKLRCCKATGGISFRQQIFPMYKLVCTILYHIIGENKNLSQIMFIIQNFQKKE